MKSSFYFCLMKLQYWESSKIFGKYPCCQRMAIKDIFTRVCFLFACFLVSFLLVYIFPCFLFACLFVSFLLVYLFPCFLFACFLSFSETIFLDSTQCQFVGSRAPNLARSSHQLTRSRVEIEKVKTILGALSTRFVHKL